MTEVRTASARRTQLPGWLAGGGVIAASMAVMNLSTYGFTVAAARLLGPREYGAIAAVMGLMLVLGVLSLGLQATGARRVSAATSEPERAEAAASTLAASYRAAAVLGLVALLAAPAVSALLRLDSWLAAALLALSTVPLTVMGGQAGVLQGEDRWGGLAAVYLGVGLGRLVLGVVAILVRDDVVGAMVGVTLGAAVPALVGWWALRGRAPSPAAARIRGVLAEVGHNAHALLAFFALCNADVVLARSILDDRDAGLYAGGLILAKAVLFLPQFVVVIAFPSMVRGDRARLHRQALLLVLGIGALATAGAWALSSLAVLFVGGSAYGELEPSLWAFAALGTLVAAVQLLVYGTVARQQRSSVLVLWAGLVLVVALAPATGSIGGLLTLVGSVYTAVLVVLLVLAARVASRARRA